MAKKTGKKTGKLDLFPIINGIIMVLFIVITLYPVLNTLAISLNDGTDALRGGIYLLPRKFTWNAAGTGSKCNPGVYCKQKTLSV